MFANSNNTATAVPSANTGTGTPEMNNINVKGFVFKQPKPMNNGKGKTCYVDLSVDSNHSPSWQMEKAKAPFGIKIDDGLLLDEMVHKSYKLKMPVELISECSANLIKEIDSITIAAAQENRALWWDKKDMSDANIVKAYKPIFKQDEEQKYAPKYTLKLVTTGKRKTQIYTVIQHNGSEMYKDGTWSDISSGCYVLPIVEFGGVWMTGVGFGPELFASQLLVWPEQKQKMFGFNLPVSMKRAPETQAEVEEPANKVVRTDDEI